MADKKISALTAATTPLDGTEVLPIVQSGATKKVANNDLRPRQIQSNATSGVLQIVGPAAAATRVMTTPDANFTAARTDAANSFSGNQTLSDGNLVVGTAGKGIDFSANGGDVLTQYDEGTWAISDISGAGLTLTVDHAKYTRVGNLVTVNVYVTYPVTVDASNALLSLPSGLSAAKYDIGTAGTSNGAAAYALTVGGTNAMSLRATNLATLTNAALSGADVLISFTYMV